MSKLTELLSRLRYANLTAHDAKMCEPVVQARNGKTLRWILPTVTILMAVLIAVSFIPGSGEEDNRTLYLMTFGLVGAQWLLYLLWFKKHKKYNRVVFYLFILTAYAFGIYESVLLGPLASNVPFCVTIVVIPLLIIDFPMRLICLSFVAETMLLLSLKFMPGKAVPFAALETLICVLIGILCTYSIQLTKFSDIRNHLMLEVQRDTDMMTGARSRVAYVRDLEMMGHKGYSAGIVYADVNGLKRANDSLGHEAGDRLIKNAFSLMLRYFHGDGDSIYRIGGDEFVIISIGSSEDSFNARFEAMSKLDENHEILSCGSHWLAHIQDTESAIKEAEKLMYAAKGRFYVEHPERDRRKR